MARSYMHGMPSTWLPTSAGPTPFARAAAGCASLTAPSEAQVDPPTSGALCDCRVKGLRCVSTGNPEHSKGHLIGHGLKMGLDACEPLPIRTGHFRRVAGAP